ncbi:hypothetical protein [Pseudalkalibacillus decolorationis]|uniref:hypothetical protein n=1 Tax=Pseudalkalibacillus decolorationis TaxID=163879 RepID=UPI00214757B1|nr:hypothetical protein [Pseudalkalibacillus decolorationis]
MIRRITGDYISFINNRKICLTHLHENVGQLRIDYQVVGNCPYAYTKAAIEKLEKAIRAPKMYVPDDDILFRELKVGTLIDFST